MEELFELLVGPMYADMRIDRYVAAEVPDLSRSQARQLIDADHIQVNQRPVRPSHLLRNGDVVTVRRPLPQPSHILPESIPLHVVYEDADVVVIDKPAGMVVHPAPGHTSGTLVNALLARYPDLTVGGEIRPGIVHRIDQDTSGLLVIARHDRAMRHLTAQQKAHTMDKAYLAVVEGTFRIREGTIDAPIGRHPLDRKRQAVLADGREARTHYRVVEELGLYTLIEARLETGRTHQIRVHFAAKHHPILGDALYGPRHPRATFGLERQFLHAYRLGFALPSDNTWHECTVPLPSDLELTLQKLRVAVALPHRTSRFAAALLVEAVDMMEAE